MREQRVRELAYRTWPEVKEAIDGGAGVVLPVGSTEQHGPHLPLSTDSLLATDLALAIAEKFDLLVAPPITYGYRSRPLTGGGQTFVGTTSLRGTTLIETIADVLRELLRHGYKRLVLINWHMENQNFIYEGAFEAAKDLPLETEAKIMIVELPFQELAPETMNFIFEGDFPGWGIEHAAILETSLMLHLHSRLVHMDRAVDDAPEIRAWYDVLPIQNEFVAKSGSLWHATKSSDEKGRRAWAEIVSQLEDAVERELDKKRFGATVVRPTR
ncbi:MAG TPA: creatininase [Candidatus Binatia bacterium]|jgi:creatinine amidohydrolase|nr:creatininase [Candidatus Binatia bacterium]